MNMIKLSVENKIEELKKIAGFVEKISIENSLKPGITFDLNLILEELVSNIIFYAYPDNHVHIIDIIFEIKPGSIVVTIIDDGIEFNPAGYSQEIKDVSLAEKPVGGLGILIVRQKTDHIEYKREAGRNILSLIRNINNNGD